MRENFCGLNEMKEVTFIIQCSNERRKKMEQFENGMNTVQEATEVATPIEDTMDMGGYTEPAPASEPAPTPEYGWVYVMDKKTFAKGMATGAGAALILKAGADKLVKAIKTKISEKKETPKKEEEEEKISGLGIRWPIYFKKSKKKATPAPNPEPVVQNTNEPAKVEQANS